MAHSLGTGLSRWRFGASGTSFWSASRRPVYLGVVVRSLATTLSASSCVSMRYGQAALDVSSMSNVVDATAWYVPRNAVTCMVTLGVARSEWTTPLDVTGAANVSELVHV